MVDGRAQARDCLLELCACKNDVQVVGEAASGRAAIDAMQTLNPDIVLLDVELPDMSGFEVLRALTTDARPLGIMMSNCADHAARAFDEGAFDYFMVPVAAKRFDRAMVRARCLLNHALTFATPRFVVGERQRKLYPLDPKSIDYVEADGNYVTLRAGKVEYLRRDSIKCLSMQLGRLGFVRIGRSLLVNAAAISYAEVAGHGSFALTLTSGVCLHSSAAYREDILRVIPLPALSRRYEGTVS
jgi:two-component system, LytTR family, response regulator